MDFLIDTTFLVGLWRQPAKGSEARFLRGHADAAFGLPWVAKGEFLAGAVIAGHDLERVAAFIADYALVLPDSDTPLHYAKAFASLRKRKLAVGPNDLWIGVAAIQTGVTLLTRNARELSRIDGLNVVDYAAD
ncbi:MAG TPA: type II toxin-antitoxin system VapC family toxin [Casimicrobiaceae bacterium]|nr:type II toxin-antitoxin system VapC family toxin [Casimicrobiaceae bacterium]